jgi:hypothetical protein
MIPARRYVPLHIHQLPPRRVSVARVHRGGGTGGVEHPPVPGAARRLGLPHRSHPRPRHRGAGPFADLAVGWLWPVVAGWSFLVVAAAAAITMGAPA